MHKTKKQVLSREEWLAERQNHLGASEIAAVLGADPYRGPLSVYEAKVNGSSVEDNDYMKFGRDVEGAIANMYSAKQKRPVKDLGATEIIYHPEFPWIGATLDRITEGTPDNPAPAGGTGPLELKSIGRFGGNPDMFRDEPDIKFQIQLQIQMACFGADWGALAALFPGYQLATVDCERNDDFLESAYPAIEAFWKRVVDRNPPPPDDKRETLDAIKRLYPSDTGETIELSENIADVVTQWEAAKAAKSHHEKEVKTLEAIIRAEIGDNTFGLLPDGSKVSLKVTKRKGYTRVVEATEFRTLRKVKG